MMVGHCSLQTTQRYIEADSEFQRKVVDLIKFQMLSGVQVPPSLLIIQYHLK